MQLWMPVVGRLDPSEETPAVIEIDSKHDSEPRDKTCTRDSFHPAEQLCSNKGPTFDCKILRYKYPYVLHML